METKANSARSVTHRQELPVIKNSLQRQEKNLRQDTCGFDGYDADPLMNETNKLRELIAKRGTLEFLFLFAALQIPYAI